jgi:alcohol dehydrogenase class IV
MPGFVHDQLPSRVVFGAGVSRTALTSEVERLGAARALVLASTRDEDRVAALTSPLGDRVTGVFTAVREHVPLPTAEAARAAAKEADADVLVAIGGGSTIGAAKAVALTAPAVPPDNPVPVGDGAMLELVRAAWTGRI